MTTIKVNALQYATQLGHAMRAMERLHRDLIAAGFTLSPTGEYVHEAANPQMHKELLAKLYQPGGVFAAEGVMRAPGKSQIWLDESPPEPGSASEGYRADAAKTKRRRRRERLD